MHRRRVTRAVRGRILEQVELGLLRQQSNKLERESVSRDIKNKNRLRIAGFYGAGDEVRTRDILLGKEAFYH